MSDPSDTFYQTLELSLNEPVGCLSMSPENRDVVLGARKGLFIIDLNHPYQPPRFLAHCAAWDVADIQWSPHPERRSWVASTVGHQPAQRPTALKLMPSSSSGGERMYVVISESLDLESGLPVGVSTISHTICFRGTHPSYVC